MYYSSITELSIQDVNLPNVKIDWSYQPRWKHHQKTPVKKFSFSRSWLHQHLQTLQIISTHCFAIYLQYVIPDTNFAHVIIMSFQLIHLHWPKFRFFQNTSCCQNLLTHVWVMSTISTPWNHLKIFGGYGLNKCYQIFQDRLSPTFVGIFPIKLKKS